MRIRERILDIVGSVLGVAVDSLDDDSSPENIESWDSLKQMSLVLALEQEFTIRFTDEEILELLSVRLLVAAVLERGPRTDSDAGR